jgi:hypothetical protein
MPRRIMMCHNIVSEIKKNLSLIEIDTSTILSRDMSAMITYCAGCVRMTYEPVQHVHLNPCPLWYVGL